MRKRSVRDIRDTVNQIGAEVDAALQKRRSGDYFHLLLLLYSLTENFLKWLVATKVCWDESCKQTDAELAGSQYSVDFETIRKNASDLTFNQAIKRAHSLNVVGVQLAARLHKVRIRRNDYIHELWIIAERKNPRVLRKELEYMAKTVHKLITAFNRLVYHEIGVDVPEVFTGI